MKTEEKKVSHKSEVVATITVPVYENMEELQEAVEPAVILSMFNKANVIRLQGNERAKFTEKRAGKGKDRNDAFNLLTTDELAEYAGDYAKLQAFLASDEMLNRVATARTDAGEPPEAAE